MLDVRLAPPQQHEQLTLYPLVSNTRTELPYLLMIDALNAGVLEITEKGTGSVPTLIARNNSDQGVLVLDGEQLIGARQNRMTNRSILLPARSETEIPVFCMEHGRWHYTSDAMKSNVPLSPSKVRRYARTLEARQSELGYGPSVRGLSAAQGEVWNEIAELSAHMETRSDTGALDHVYETHAHRIEEYARSFAAVPDQVGLLAFTAGAPLGMDLIGGIELYSRLHARLLHGYVVDALSATTRRADEPNPATAEEFLELVRVAERNDAPSVGMGTYIVLSRTVVGGELSDNDRVVHLSAFPRDQREREDVGMTYRVTETPVAPPSRRKKR